MANEPHSFNAKGDFYVMDGCCTMCMVPFVEAPELFGEAMDVEGTFHCFVQRQPRTRNELTGMLRAAWHSELACIRYSGSEASILDRFDEYGESSLCDAPHLFKDTVFRNHVQFRSATQRLGPQSAKDLALLFKSSPTHSNARTTPLRFSNESNNGPTHTLSIAWHEDNFHPIEFRSLDTNKSSWLIRHSTHEITGSKAVSWLLHDWIMKDPRFNSPSWYSTEEWTDGVEGSPTPW